MMLLKWVLGILAGFLAAGLVIAVTEAVGHALVQGEAVFGIAIIAYGLGAAVGTAVAGRLAGRRSSTLVPILLGALATINLWSFAHPWWFAIACVGALALGGLVGDALSRQFAPARNEEA